MTSSLSAAEAAAGDHGVTFAVRAVDLTLEVGRRRVLGPFGVDVSIGEAVALLGANGSGKTTALRLILGLVRATSGTSEVHGKLVSPLRPPQGVGYVPDRVVFHDWDTARNNLALLHDDAARVGAALTEVGLAAAADRRVRGFSRGMRQRLNLARALAADPELLVMDEPTIALDVDGIAMLARILRARQEQGLSTLLATHDRDFLSEIDARVVHVREGTMM